MSGLEVRAAPGVATESVRRFAENLGLSGYLFRTSGSSGVPKWVHLTSSAIERAAAASRESIGAAAGSRWVAALPDYHVGGFMVYARAGSVAQLEGRWNVERFCQLCAGSEFSALVPTQVADLVSSGKTCPSGVKAVLVGGGSLDEKLYECARRLGWPLVRSYGMTETSASIAVEEKPGSHWMTLQSDWEATLSGDGCLCLKGVALFSGYIRGQEGAWHYEKSGEWFQTSDRVELNGRRLRYLGRADRMVKVLGELVSLPELESAIRKAVPDSAVLALPAERAGHKLVAVGICGDALKKALNQWNERAVGYQRILHYYEVVEMPRTTIGKIDLMACHELIRTQNEFTIS